MLERPDGAAWRWIPPGGLAVVGAHAISGGLIYVGRHLGAADGVEPALINPALPVTAPTGRPADPGAGSRLAYHLLSPGARWSYLDWLARGRRTEVAPGLVLLFCFGLERRVLLDADHDQAVRGELPTIVAEARRLLARYGDSGWRPLRTALDNLLDLLDLLAAPRATPGRTAPAAGRRAAGTAVLGRGGGGVVVGRDGGVVVGRDGGGVVVGRDGGGAGRRDSGKAFLGRDGGALTLARLRTALARLAAASAPVPADLARAWARHHPSLPPRGAELDCPAEFDRMFALLYRDRHGSGLVPPDDVPGVRLRYRPANPGLTTTLVCREDLPDVLTEPRCTRALAGLIDGVADALGPYRRWLAKFPEGRGSLAAAALLPRELVDAGHGRLGALRVWAERQLDGRPWAVIDASGFWEFWSTAAPDRMARDEAAALLGVLALLDIGVEPDVRFGAPALTRGPAVLFRLARPASDRPGARFPSAAAIARCAAAVASAARPVRPHGPYGAAVVGTAGDLAAALRLDPGEDLRLAARLAWLLLVDVDIDRLGRQSSMVTAAEREVAGQHLIAVAVAADPECGPATVAALTRVYKILGLEPDLVFPRLHERAVGVTRRAAGVTPALPHPARQPGSPYQPGSPCQPGLARQEEPCLDGCDGPVVVRAADTTPTGYALPWAADHAMADSAVGDQPAADGVVSDLFDQFVGDQFVADQFVGDRAPSGLKLDRDLITRKVADSAVAAELLDAIFRAGDDADEGGWRAIPPDPGCPDPIPCPNATPCPDPIPCPDDTSGALLRALAAKPVWAREEFASLAAAHRMLPDGALDLLNEFAIERTGAPVIEDNGSLTIDSDILSELLA